MVPLCHPEMSQCGWQDVKVQLLTTLCAVECQSHACTCTHTCTYACMHMHSHALTHSHRHAYIHSHMRACPRMQDLKTGIDEKASFSWFWGIYTWIKQLPFLNCLFNKNFNRMSEYLLWNFVVVLSSSRYNPSGLTGTSSENCHRCVVCFSGISPAHTLLYSSRRGEEAAGLEVCSASLAAAAITRWSFPMTKTLL